MPPNPVAGKSHPQCHGPDGHICQQPSGQQCIEPDCRNPAGTIWGPLWCPDCDVERLDEIGAQFAALGRQGSAA
jgi:hypothetical protein